MNKIVIAISLTAVLILVPVIWGLFVIISEMHYPELQDNEEQILVNPSIPSVQDVTEVPYFTSPQHRDLENYINYRTEGGGEFDLPLRGATGWAARSTPLRVDGTGSQLQLTAGQAFTILDIYGDFFRVLTPDQTTGLILKNHSFVNLPDILPSIVYNIANAHSSVKLTYGFPIENVTGSQLYSAHSFNERLGREEFIVPASLSTARLLSVAQQIALQNGDTLVMYETYRPRSAQLSIVENLRITLNSNPVPDNAIRNSPWTLGWFISTGISNHQRGTSVDVSLARINTATTEISGGYRYLFIETYSLYEMMSPMHDLSPLAAIVYTPISLSWAGWHNAVLRNNMTEGSLRLHSYMLEAGFIPLASEWWHFDDPEGSRIARANSIAGDFYTETVYSVAIYTQ